MRKRAIETPWLSHRPRKKKSTYASAIQKYSAKRMTVAAPIIGARDSGAAATQQPATIQPIDSTSAAHLRQVRVAAPSPTCHQRPSRSARPTKSTRAPVTKGEDERRRLSRKNMSKPTLLSS